MGVAAWALVISIFAATTGIASLVWQVISWRRNGPSILVEAEVHAGYGKPIIAVKLHNRGRGDVGLQEAWLEHKDDDSFSFRRNLSVAMELPTTIEGLHGGTWYTRLRQGDYREDLKKHASLKVRLGSGKVISGRVDTGFWDYPAELLFHGKDRLVELPQA